MKKPVVEPLVSSEFSFIGRKPELQRFQQLKVKNKASLVIVRGRRRIGKSRFIEEAAKKDLFFKFAGLAPDEKVTAEDQRKNFAFALIKHFQVPLPDSSDWNHLFFNLTHCISQNLAENTAGKKNKKIIILLDEISWMAQDDPTFLPKLKNSWDDDLSKIPGLILVLCGSVSSWIEKNILSSTGFLGRIHETLCLEELSLEESLLLLSQQGFEGSSFEKLMVLSVTGGVPWYLEQFIKGLNASAHLRHLCFSSGGLFVLEFERLFHDLFGKRAQLYATLVQALINGPKTYQGLSEETGYPSSGALSEYLDDLVISGFLRKENSWAIQTGVEKSIVQYRLKDNYLRFYFKLIRPQLNAIKNNRMTNQVILDLKGFSTFLGFQFENIVLNNRSLIFKALGLKPEEILMDNPFLQRATKIQEGCQIDWLIQTRTQALYVCEMKVTRSSISSSVMTEVKEKIRKLKTPKGVSCMAVLIHFGEIPELIKDEGYFYQCINFEDYFY